MRSEVGESRKSRIAAMVAIGLPNAAIWAAMERLYPQVIIDNQIRADVCKSLGIAIMDYDSQERERLGWAIRQVKSMEVKEDREINDLIEELGDCEMKSPDQIRYINRARFTSGIDGLDWVYGHTIYRWTEDDVEHRYCCGDLMYFYPGWGHQWVASGPSDAKIERGLPESFLSIWGGSPGAGKTRLAIALTKSLNKLGHRVLYFNGEADEMDFRSWLGSKVDNDHLRIVSGEMIRNEEAIERVYQFQPKVVIVDSFQMLAEVNKGGRGARTTLYRLKELKSDIEANKPHIILISQLNKKGELAGSRYLEHMVDFVATITKSKDRKNCFIFECSRKNRGGETPRAAVFRHTETGIEGLGIEPL